ncbi:hypothetical protein M514_04398 [Trichuris suis]|uniref:Uncharacterized protein n=1 Tax=Trichuris suis TaxID=68888 RepID=A0A085N4G7_9BILA|nr:hypothetical protein M513_04398 [Trichuris suis]KFD64363.1 hypothetical protein M514_04398 [Trichuris suis]
MSQCWFRQEWIESAGRSNPCRQREAPIRQWFLWKELSLHIVLGCTESEHFDACPPPADTLITPSVETGGPVMGFDHYAS